MKKTLLLLTGFLLIAGTFSSCKKDCPVDEPTKTELLTSHEWHAIDAITYTNGTQTNTQDVSEYDWLFAVNKDLFIYKNGSITEYYKWQYITGSPDIIKLTAVSGGPIVNILNNAGNIQTRVAQTYELKVKDLNDTKLTFYMENTDSSTGDTTKIVFHLKK